jgi:hypothetical protein
MGKKQNPVLAATTTATVTTNGSSILGNICVRPCVRSGDSTTKGLMANEQEGNSVGRKD